MVFSKRGYCCLRSVAFVEESMLMLLWAVIIRVVVFRNHWRVYRIIVARRWVVVGIRYVFWRPGVMRVLLALVILLLIHLHFFIVFCSDDWAA